MLSLIDNDAQYSLQPPLANDSDQRWGNVGNRGWDSRTGLGFIVPDITRSIGGLGDLPVLEGFGETTLTPGVIAIGLMGIAIGVAAPAYGAYRGAKTSPGWAAGGAVIGMVTAGLAQALLATLYGATIVKQS